MDLCIELVAWSQGFQSCSPLLFYSSCCIPPDWEMERDRPAERLLAVNPGPTGVSWTAVSNKVSRQTPTKKTEYFTTIHRKRRKRVEEWWRDLLKSLNDRGHFLLTRRKGYNDSTDWRIIRFQSWMIGSKRILLCLFRRIARQNPVHPACSLRWDCRICGKKRNQCSGVSTVMGNDKRLFDLIQDIETLKHLSRFYMLQTCPKRLN